MYECAVTPFEEGEKEFVLLQFTTMTAPDAINIYNTSFKWNFPGSD